MFLEREGHEVIEASEGEAALKLQREREVDLVITDIIMPHLNGFSVIRQIRREYPNLAIIAASGIGGEDYPHKASELGADRTLEKPFTRTELLEAVNELLAKKRSD